MKPKKEVNRDFYYRRRNKVFELLGGCCNKCGSHDRLRLKHKDPAITFNTSLLGVLSWDTIVNTLPDVDLLCYDHFYEKKKHACYRPQDHGQGRTGKHNCKCPICRDKKNEYMREWRKERKIKRQQELEELEQLRSQCLVA